MRKGQRRSKLTFFDLDKFNGKRYNMFARSRKVKKFDFK